MKCRLARLHRGWLSPGKVTRIFRGRYPNGTIKFNFFFFLKESRQPQPVIANYILVLFAREVAKLRLRRAWRIATMLFKGFEGKIQGFADRLQSPLCDNYNIAARQLNDLGGHKTQIKCPKIRSPSEIASDSARVSLYALLCSKYN